MLASEEFLKQEMDRSVPSHTGLYKVTYISIGHISHWPIKCLLLSDKQIVYTLLRSSPVHVCQY